MTNGWLFAGGVLSGIASILHLGCIVGGPAWYRFFGAGERIARMAERDMIEPTIVTLFIAAVLAGWSVYALSGAGVLRGLPLLRPILVAICAVYLLRAAALPVMLATMHERSATFLVWSSAIVLVIGMVHAIGLWTGWARLGQ